MFVLLSMWSAIGSLTYNFKPPSFVSKATMDQAYFMCVAVENFSVKRICIFWTLKSVLENGLAP